MSSASPVIYAALRERYCAPEFALFFEVANGTGSNVRRYADALAMNLFPSRGLTLNGFEIKVSAHDWKRELKNPHKAEEGIFKYCDHWWIVAPAGVVAKTELPSTWGLLEMPDKGGLRQVVAAPRLKPQELNRNFIAALLRRASVADQSVVDELVRKGVDEARARIDDEVERRVTTRLRDVERKMAIIDGIERQAGMKFTDWNAHDGYGRIIKAIEATGIAKQWGCLRSLAQTLEGMSKTIATHLAEFDALAPDVPEAAAKLDKTAALSTLAREVAA
jgi:hypothetical protein